MSDLDNQVLGVLQEALAALPRSDAWAVVSKTPGLPKGLQGAIKEHARLSRQLEKLQKRNDRIVLRNQNRRCGRCGQPVLLHKDKAVNKRCMYVMRLRHFVKKTWAERWSDPSKRKTRMMKAWRARRAKKDQRLLEAIHPRVRTVIGDAELLRRLGRDPDSDAVQYRI